MKPADQELLWRRRLRRTRLLAWLLGAALVAALVPYPLRWVREHALDLGVMRIDSKAPHAAAVRRIFEEIGYSGLAIIQQPDFRLSVDFDKQAWMAHHIHRYDAQGRLELCESGKGKYGLCGDLATHVADQLRPRLQPQQTLEFVRVAESQFFPSSVAAHYALRILEAQPPDPPRIYILDPSFRRYGPIEDFEDYLFYEPRSEMAFVSTRATDETFPAGQATPLLLHSKVMLGLVIAHEGRRFDPEHYRLSLVATFRHRYMSRRILSIRRLGDRIEVIENAKLARQAVPAGEYAALRARLLELFHTMALKGTGGQTATEAAPLPELLEIR